MNDKGGEAVGYVFFVLLTILILGQIPHLHFLVPVAKNLATVALVVALVLICFSDSVFTSF